MGDPLESLELLLPELPDAVDRRRLGDRLNQAMATLKDADRQVERLRALLALAEATEFGGEPNQGEVLSNIKQEAWEVGTLLEAADNEEDLRAAVWDYEKSFVKTLALLDRDIRSAWRIFANERFQPLIGFGDLLARIEGVADLGRRLSDCGRRAQALSTGGSSLELLASVRGLISDRKALQTERASTIGAGEVGDFLNALAEDRATLDMVTAEVRDWLSIHDALRMFNVSPG